MERRDVVILGAGAAGLFCAGSLAGRGLGVTILDHARAAGEKIRISGGGRCNFTNLATSHDRFLSDTPRFCASALAGYTPQDFVALVDRAGIGWHEKTQGQLFCDGSARQIVSMLIDRAQAELRLGVEVEEVTPTAEGLVVRTTAGPILAGRVVVATGGKSVPKMGASGIGYRIAEQALQRTAPLAGVSVETEATTCQPPRKGQRPPRFRDQLLFTHRGLSGPAILQISSFWQPGEAIRLDLAPGADAAARLRAARQRGGKAQLGTALAQILPARLAAAIAAEEGLAEARLADQPDTVLDRLGRRINQWQISPVGSEGYRTAEVTVGGVDCRDLDARTMQSRRVPGLYFIGEVVDVTGWLGGYNFQWAWASGHAAARAITAG